MVLENPAIPIYFGKNRPGMSAAEEVDDLPTALRIWDEAMRLALKKHEELEALGVHKEITNRLLLPFQHVTHLVTATAWDNWFDLRLNGAAIEHAQPDIVALARKIDVAMRQSTPQKLEYGEWHLPFVTPEDLEYDFACSAGFAHAAHQVPEVTLLSAARAARTSFLPETPKAISTELTFSRKLSVDKHWSPFEHVATPFDERFFHPSTQRNFSGWTQLRALIGG
jgi:thymidylate synthase ThyX